MGLGIEDTQRRVVPGIMDDYIVHLHAHNVNTNRQLMLIDLSNPDGKWPHPSNSGRLHLKSVKVNLNPDNVFDGDVYIGFLDDVDDSGGDFHAIHTWHFQKTGIQVPDGELGFGGPGSELVCVPGRKLFTEVYEADARFQNDVDIVGPDGGNYRCGDGDIVASITDRTTGAIDMTFMLIYGAS